MNVITRAVLVTAIVCAVRDRDERAQPPPAVSSVMLADETYTYLPLAGRPLVEGTRTGKDCLALLPHLVTHRSWALGIVETEWTVLGGTTTIASLDIADDGEITLERQTRGPDLPRRYFYLNDDEVAELRRLNDLPCSDDRRPLDHVRTFHVYYTPMFGVTTEQGAAIPATSPMGMAIDRILRAAAARYVPARIGAARRLQLDLQMPSSNGAPYRIRVADGTVVVRRGTRRLFRRTLTEEELVDLADWSPPEEWDGGYQPAEGWARGSLFDGDTTRHPIVFGAAQLSSIVPNLGGELGDAIDADR